MALSATPGLIKIKQIHGAPGGEKKKYSGWTAGGTLGKPREPKINVLVLRYGSSLLPGWLIPCVEDRSVSSRACSLPPSSHHRFFFFFFPCPIWDSRNDCRRLESLIRRGTEDTHGGTWKYVAVGWRHFWKGWKTGTTGMPDVRSGVRPLIFTADAPQS